MAATRTKTTSTTVAPKTRRKPVKRRKRRASKLTMSLARATKLQQAKAAGFPAMVMGVDPQIVEGLDWDIFANIDWVSLLKSVGGLLLAWIEATFLPMLMKSNQALATILAAIITSLRAALGTQAAVA